MSMGKEQKNRGFDPDEIKDYKTKMISLGKPYLFDDEDERRMNTCIFILSEDSKEETLYMML
jgi:hypothetical protein